MDLPRYAKGAIAFLLILAVAHVWTMVSTVYKPPWQPWLPLVPLMKDFVVPFTHQLYRPILIGGTGLAIFWIWDGKRAGYILALFLTFISAAFGVLIVIFNFMAGEWSGTFTALIAVAFPSVMACWFSYQGYRQHEVDRQ